MIFLCSKRYVATRATQMAASLLALLFSPLAQAQVCPFDDGHSSLAVEGVILTRYALGLTGAPLVASTGINAVDAPSVEATINCPSCGLHITGNATLTVADATIISRKLAGFQGSALTNGLALGGGTRNTPAAVQSFLLTGCGVTGGTVTSITAGTGLTGGITTSSGTIAADTTYLQRRVSASCAVGSSIRVIAADGSVTCQTDSVGPLNAFVQNGNAFGVPALLGTTDTQPLRVISGGASISLETPNGNGLRVIRSAGALADAPNIVNGSAQNAVSGQGATVAGGGFAGSTCFDPATNLSGLCSNRANSNFATVSGGAGNVAISGSSTVAGGNNNLATTAAYAGSIGGGEQNSVGAYAATVGGGHSNIASGLGATVAGGNANYASDTESVVGGGKGNAARNTYAVVSGGSANFALGSFGTVGGGESNVAFGLHSTVPGGDRSRAIGIASFAAGTIAVAQHDGAFVWADAQGAAYQSNGINSFNIRASGGVHINTDSSLYFGNQTRQMLNLGGPTAYGTAYGIGVQGDTLYYRSNNEFCWFVSGSHSNAQCDPGVGGGTRMRLNGFGLSVNGVFISSSDRNLKPKFLSYPLKSNVGAGGGFGLSASI